MAKLIINNRGNKKKPSWQYRFETAKVDGKRRYVSKAGFRTKEEAIAQRKVWEATLI